MSKTVRPGTITQTTGGKFQSFTNINNIKKDSDYAQALIHGKNQPLNRPSTITVKNFNAGLPTGAVVTKISVEIKHSKAPYQNKNCNVPAPTITLMNGNTSLKWSSGADKGQPMQRKGKAPTTSASKFTVNYGTVQNYDFINTSDFGVRIDYPTNTNNNEGYVRVYYVKVILEYRTAKFGVKIDHLSGEYNGDLFSFSITCSNVNNVKYLPTVTIDAPLGFSLHEAKTIGKFTQVSARTFNWKPALGYNKGSDVLTISFDSNVTFSGNSESVPATFNAVESLAQREDSKTVNVLKKAPIDSDVDPPDKDSSSPVIPDEKAGIENQEIVSLTVSQGFTFELDLPEDIQNFKLWCCTVTNGNFTEYSLSNLSSVMRVRNPSDDSWSYQTFSSKTFSRDAFTFLTDITNFAITTKGPYVLVITPSNSTEILKVIFVDVKPSTLTNPFRTLLKLSDEECNRLGHGYSYTAQSFINIVTSEGYVRDWGTNFRMGIFNNKVLREDTWYNDGHMACLYQNEQFNFYFPTLQNVIGFNVYYSDTVYHDNIKLKKTLSALQDFTVRQYDADVIDVTLNLLLEESEVAETFNFRLNFTEGTIKTLYEPTIYNLTDAEIMDNMEYWSDVPQHPNTFENIEVKFPYNENYPVYVIITGDYLNSGKNVDVQFTEPCIAEDYTSHVDNGIYPAPILDVVGEDTFSEIEIPSASNSDTIIFYDLPLEENYGTNDEMVIRGLAITGTVDFNTDDLLLEVSLVNGKNVSKNRSIVLDENNPKNYEDNEFSIGQVGDLFGFKTNEIVDLDDWEIHMALNNVLNSFTAQASIGDLSLEIFVEKVVDQLQRWIVEDEDLSSYGVFLQDVKIPVGLKSETAYIDVDGTDTNDPYRTNIERKTIEVEFSINSCDIESSTLALREVARLLTPKRDKYHRTLLKRVEFSHYPDVFWEYLMDEPIDAEAEGTGYNCKAKLIVPAGTSYDKKVTSTGNTGFVSGLAAIRPIIQFSPSENVIAISETYSNQEFHMGYDGDWFGKIVEIDCDNRIVYLKESEDDDDPINISYAVDINSDWFVLDGEYEFKTVGCAIRSVDWQERW